MVPLSPTSFVVREGVARAMEEAEGFFLTLGARITQREMYSMRAVVCHPDGFATNVQVKYYRLTDEEGGDEDMLEIVRCSGDPILFAILFRMFVDYGMGHGVVPAPFYHGQMLPRLVRIQSSAPPFIEVPSLRLDGGGDKRKADEMTQRA